MQVGNEFNNVIDELAKINRAAQNYEAETDSAKEQLLSDYQKKRDEIDVEVRGAMKERLNEYRSELEAENKIQSHALKMEFEGNMEKLENAFAENHTVWAQEIADSIVSDHSL